MLVIISQTFYIFKHLNPNLMKKREPISHIMTTDPYVLN
jgi:hypothetical protein